MKYPFLAFLLAVSIGSAASQEVHLVSPGSNVWKPLSPATLNERVEHASTKYQQYAPVPRFGVYDVAYPRDIAEFADTGGYGIVLVVLYSQQTAELPLRRLALRTGAELVELELLSSASSEVETTSSVNRVFGKNRWEALYVYPAYAQQPGSELVADFRTNRTGFVLAKFTEAGTVRTPGAEAPQVTTSKPKHGALLTLIEREYPGFIVGNPAPMEPNTKTR